MCPNFFELKIIIGYPMTNALLIIIFFKFKVVPLATQKLGTFKFIAEFL